jgi:hypothetical protein
MKLLGDGDERDLVLVEELHDPGKIEQRATEAVQLVGQYGVDRTGGDILQEPLEGGPVQVAAAVAAAIVALRQRQPALAVFARCLPSLGRRSRTGPNHTVKGSSPFVGGNRVSRWPPSGGWGNWLDG